MPALGSWRRFGEPPVAGVDGALGACRRAGLRSKQASIQQTSICAAPHHDVVEERDRESGPSFRQRAGESDVLGAGGRVSARVVVHDDESGSGLANHGHEHVAWEHRAAVQTTTSCLPSRAEPRSRIDAENPQFLVLQGAQTRLCPSKNALRSQRLARDGDARFSLYSVTELNGGEHSNGIGLADVCVRCQPSSPKASESRETAGAGDQPIGSLPCGMISSRGVQHQGNQLLVREQ